LISIKNEFSPVLLKTASNIYIYKSNKILVKFGLKKLSPQLLAFSIKLKFDVYELKELLQFLILTENKYVHILYLFEPKSHSWNMFLYLGAIVRVDDKCYRILVVRQCLTKFLFVKLTSFQFPLFKFAKKISLEILF